MSGGGDALSMARRMTAALVLAPLAVWILSHPFQRSLEVPHLAFIAALAGIVAPSIGYRIYRSRRERLPSDADVTAREKAFVGATVGALSFSGAVALLAGGVHWVTGDPVTVLAPVMHVLLAGAVWPSRVRLESFLDDPGRRGEVG